MNEENENNGGCGCGCGTFFTIGTVLAVIISWGLNKSIFWAIVHGFCNWFYVLYWYYIFN